MGGKPEPKPPTDTATWGKWDSWSSWSPSGWVEYEAPTPAPDQMLRAARDNLNAVVGIFPAGHAAIAEMTNKVAELEAKQKGSVSKSEKLRCLLYEQKAQEYKVTNADTDVSEKAQAVKAATAALRISMTASEEAKRELAANQLEVAALTREVGAPEGNVACDMVQALRSRVDVLADCDFADGGFGRAELGAFFNGFAKLSALIDHAEQRTTATAPPTAHAPAPPPTPAPAPAPAPTPTGFDPVAAAAGGELAEARATELLSDDDGASADSDGDATMTGETRALAAMEDADKTLAMSASWLTTEPGAGGSSG